MDGMTVECVLSVTGFNEAAAVTPRKICANADVVVTPVAALL
jgi:hypothetical protein